MISRSSGVKPTARPGISFLMPSPLVIQVEDRPQGRIIHKADGEVREEIRTPEQRVLAVRELRGERRRSAGPKETVQQEDIGWLDEAC